MSLEEQIKNIDAILRLSEDEYRSFIVEIIDENEDERFWLLDSLDDQLLKQSQSNPLEVEKICKLNEIIFTDIEESYTRKYALSYNYNTLLRSLIAQNKIIESKDVFLKGLSACKEHEQVLAGKSLCSNVPALIFSSMLPHEEAIYLQRQTVDYYKSIGKHEDAINMLITASYFFTDVSAFQSAYRALSDAEMIANEEKNSEWLCKISEACGTVSMAEGDIQHADKCFQNSLKYYESTDSEPNNGLISNIATAKQRLGDHKAAKDLYLNLLANIQDQANIQQICQININLLICLRELNELENVDKLTNQIESNSEHLDEENKIEAMLVLAKTYYHFDKVKKGHSRLKQACYAINEAINNYHRLHYRRGVREQYIQRLKSMLANLDFTGNADDAISTVIMCSSNSLQDWFSVLNWAEMVQTSKSIPHSAKQKISSTIEELIQFGTPFLYGFREKYDDPFEAPPSESFCSPDQVVGGIDHSQPWRAFNDISSEISHLYSLPSPYHDSSIQNVLSVINKRLGSKTAFIFSFICPDGMNLILFIGSNYYRVVVDNDHIKEYLKELFNYQQPGRGVRPFYQCLDRTKKIIQKKIDPILPLIVDKDISEIVHLPDYLTEALPLLPIFIENSQLRDRIKNSELAFRNCPALIEKKEEEENKGHAVFVTDSSDNLCLVESEKPKFVDYFDNEDNIYIDLRYEKLDFDKQDVSSATALHLSAHNIPPNQFTDPMFVSTSADRTKNSIWLESVQRNAHKLNFSFVFLNGCNTATTKNSNYFKKFITSEKIGLTSTFLINRKCSVISTLWNEKEIVAYVFTALLYKRMKTISNKSRCYSLAIVDMFELSKEDSISIIQDILDEKTRDRYINSLSMAPVDYPFRHSYNIGMFQFSSLL